MYEGPAAAARPASAHRTPHLPADQRKPRRPREAVRRSVRNSDEVRSDGHDRKLNGIRGQPPPNAFGSLIEKNPQISQKKRSQKRRKQNRRKSEEKISGH